MKKVIAKKVIAVILALAFIASAVSLAFADEGMWTFDNPPRKQWKERYNFEPSDAWLEHVRLASVRLGAVGSSGGGSGAFVSAEGLVVTNQHVGADQLAKLSTKERDLARVGFYAPTRAEELKCPDFEVNVLVSFEDVTRRVQGAAKSGATAAEAAQQRRAEMAAVERESNEKTGLRSDVLTLYSGGEYWLYRFKRYTDVRLVFAPEEGIAFFGGDYDNFTFPRYNLDVTFFRVYENDQPAKTEHYFKWSKAGPSDGEFVVAAGSPGSTNRLLTLAQLRYQRDVGNPLQMQVWSSRRDALARYAAGGEEQARRAQSARRSLENSIKRLTGQQDGLGSARMFALKETQERELRGHVAANAEWKREYDPAWGQIEAAYKNLPGMAKRIAFSTLAPSRLGTLASQLVRYAEEAGKPNEHRLEEFRDNRLEALKASVSSSATIYPDLEEAILAAWLEEARKALGPTDPFVSAALDGQTAAEAARRAVAGTKLADPAARKSLFEAGPAAIMKSDDPLVALARRVEPAYRELRAWNEQNVLSVDTSAGQRIAAARYAVYGRTLPPDASSSLRISYGKVLGYEEDTTRVPFKTTFYGLYDRAESFGEKPPYDLPPRWREGRAKLDLATPFNFVYTADTIGGSSGSPVINRAAEIVGLNFDSNIQKLPNRYWYIDDPLGSRAVAVHSSAIIHALERMYDAGKLAEEIKGVGSR